MSVLKITEVPSPVLRQTSAKIEKITKEVLHLLDDMLETLYTTEAGIGLAAPQIGKSLRLVVIDINAGTDHKSPIFLINPEITYLSEDEEISDEGCLSLPHISADVRRPKCATITYLDRTGKKQELAGEGLLARAFQHEIDHLNGKLFIDYVSPLKRKMLIRKMEKLRREESETKD